MEYHVEGGRRYAELGGNFLATSFFDDAEANRAGVARVDSVERARELRARRLEVAPLDEGLGEALVSCLARRLLGFALEILLLEEDFSAPGSQECDRAAQPPHWPARHADPHLAF